MSLVLETDETLHRTPQQLIARCQGKHFPAVAERRVAVSAEPFLENADGGIGGGVAEVVEAATGRTGILDGELVQQRGGANRMSQFFTMPLRQYLA